MADNRYINCVGRITNTGALGIIDKGFCYSKTEPHPDITNSLRWSEPSATLPDGTFASTLSGLTESTYYWINSYAINSMGIDYSDPDQTIYIKTGGVTILPTITVNITKNGLDKNIFEIGTSSNLVVSGEITKNDETTFNGGGITQSSSPPPSTNPILTWTGYQATYTTVNPVIYAPTTNQDSWNFKEKAYEYCGSPQYTIEANDSVEAVFPFLWVLKNSVVTAGYFSPISTTTDYFYYQASSTPAPAPKNGKLIETKGDKTFMMTPSSSSYKYLYLGYPAFYGNIQYSLNGTLWAQNPNLTTTNVGTGSYGYQFGIVNPWPWYSYKILTYAFTSYSSIPIPFYIRFV